MQNDGQQTCYATGKIQWRTAHDAKRAARRMREKTGDKLTPYVCRRCQHWHIGHTPYFKQRRYKLIRTGQLKYVQPRHHSAE